MIVTGSHISCGVRQLYDIAESPKVLLAALKHHIRNSSAGEQRWRYAMFSTNNHYQMYFDSFVAYIKDNKLGTVITTGWEENPNTENDIAVAVWSVDWTALRAYFKQTDTVQAQISDAVTSATGPVMRMWSTIRNA